MGLCSVVVLNLEGNATKRRRTQFTRTHWMAMTTTLEMKVKAEDGPTSSNLTREDKAHMCVGGACGEMGVESNWRSLMVQMNTTFH